MSQDSTKMGNKSKNIEKTKEKQCFLISQEGVLEASWRLLEALEGVLEGLGGVLEALEAILEALGGV